jgi:S1-C subfamily serine protease
MEDPRTVFYIPEDHQVIVYMEWEGPPGKHHIEGFWKSPAGKTAAMTDFDYEAKQNKFGAFFTFTLSDSMALGGWSLEAHVDGEPSGSHAFQIMGGNRPADMAPARKMLTPSELYEHAVQSAVTVEAVDIKGQRFRSASGFLMEPDWIVTAFENIDGATKLRLKYSDGSQFETDQLVSWNRRQDWAVLKAGPTKPKLKRAAVDSWSVGDTAMYLETAPEGNRVITNVSIDGKNVFPGAGMRVNISAAPTDGAIGTCLLNEYGEVIGVIGGTIVPGASAMKFLEIASPTPVAAGSRVYMRGGLAVPITLLPTSVTQAPTPLSALEAKGEFLPPVTASRNVVYGQLARTVNTKGGLPFPVDSTDSFSKHDAKVNVYVLWEGREKTKGLVTARLFDVDNHLLNKSSLEKPMKFSINRGEQKTTTWEFSTANLPIGVYRIDVWLDDAPAWRTFWRLSE